MKKLLLLKLFLLIAIIANSQTISGYFSMPSSMYAAIEPSPVLDHSNDGMDAVWNFTSLVKSNATTTDSYKDLTVGSPEEILYPLSNYEMSNLTSTGTENNFYYLNAKAINRVWVTGTESLGLMLQYDDIGLIGDFPFNFNGTNGIDDVAGDFSFAGNNGTFSGTITSTVDAYGTLSMNDVGGGTYNGKVTRLKVEQDIVLTLGVLSGTVNQTTYHYYDNESGDLMLRSTILDISTPLGNSSQVGTESLISGTLSTRSAFADVLGFQMNENPVKDFLSYSVNTDLVLKAIQVFDIGGREVLKLNVDQRSVNVNYLNSGLYILRISTDKGQLSQKFLKL